QPVPAPLQGRPVHVHNRLIASATSAPALREKIAGEIGSRLAQARGPTCLLLPLRGVEQWDRPGEPLHDARGLQAFITAMRGAVQNGTRCIELDAHINDAAFAEQALSVFDEWVAQGLVPRGAAP
ncbi:MAG: Tm-1-like ATP-binding domain-containing protein, partial [Rubrivivax sp.]